MLALKTILARIDRVPTLIFDEVDAGIGGKVGLMVGDSMRRVAGHHQVFAITHLPQIAARAHHHIVVSKGAKGGVTTADIVVVEGETRVHEIARLLGGRSGEQAFAGARHGVAGGGEGRSGKGEKGARSELSGRTRRYNELAPGGAVIARTTSDRCASSPDPRRSSARARASRASSRSGNTRCRTESPTCVS